MLTYKLCYSMLRFSYLMVHCSRKLWLWICIFSYTLSYCQWVKRLMLISQASNIIQTKNRRTRFSNSLRESFLSSVVNKSSTEFVRCKPLTKLTMSSSSGLKKTKQFNYAISSQNISFHQNELLFIQIILFIHLNRVKI